MYYPNHDTRKYEDWGYIQNPDTYLKSIKFQQSIFKEVRGCDVDGIWERRGKFLVTEYKYNATLDNEIVLPFGQGRMLEMLHKQENFQVVLVTWNNGSNVGISLFENFEKVKHNGKDYYKLQMKKVPKEHFIRILKEWVKNPFDLREVL